jgi:hypothetical protein
MIAYINDSRVSVSRVYLNGGGYDRTGEYFGVGAPLFHAFNDSDTINFHVRAYDRADAVAEVRRRYPGSIFFRS